jgi:hypothetical protein
MSPLCPFRGNALEPFTGSQVRCLATRVIGMASCSVRPRLHAFQHACLCVVDGPDFTQADTSLPLNRDPLPNHSVVAQCRNRNGASTALLVGAKIAHSAANPSRCL